jgi:hypothetical protein
MLVNKAFLIRIREGKELKAPRYASAAATRNGNLPLRDGSLPYLTATYLIPDKYFTKYSKVDSIQTVTILNN